MRGLPDSAIVGTYKRARRLGRKPRRKSHRREADFLYDALVGTIYAIGKITNPKKK